MARREGGGPARRERALEMTGWSDEQFDLITDTPWGVPVLDVQPLTQNVTASSEDPSCARNAMSYTGLEGAELSAQPLESGRVTDAALRLPVEGPLIDGIVARPATMEDKWAVYLEAGELLFVRSWRRRVVARAAVRVAGRTAVVGPVRGAFTADDETAAYTRRVLEYVVRDVALGEDLPVPLPFDYDGERVRAAIYAFSLFGQRARFATHEPVKLQPPARPLCTYTPLHIAVAQQALPEVRAALAAGTPPAVLAPDGLSPLHWAVEGEPAIVDILLDAGASVNARSRQGATPLMQAVQEGALETVRHLLGRSADVDAADARGFTALHRAAEMGELDVVGCLLLAGADPAASAEGQTAMALAQASGHADVVDRLRSALDELRARALP